MKQLLSLLLMTVCSTAYADWKLNNEQSSLNFISTKNQHISETHSFGQLAGILSDDGNLKVRVTLSSVDTGIEIRDQRMRDMLFKVADIPSATLSAKIDKSLLKAEVGQSTFSKVDATFHVNGKSVTMPVSIQVTKLAGNALLATTTAPVLINATSFDLDGGVAALQKIAGLAGISLTVPLTFNVTFIAQ